MTDARKRELEAWVTTATHDQRRVTDYLDFSEAERAYARRFCTDYAQSPLTGLDAKLDLAQLQIDMANMERSLEWMLEESARIAESDGATWNGGCPK